MNRQKTDTHMGQLHNPRCSCMPRVNKRLVTYCICTGSPEPGNISCELQYSSPDPGDKLCHKWY